MRVACLTALLASGCYCSHGPVDDAGLTDDAGDDAGPIEDAGLPLEDDAGPPIVVEGCDEPRLWVATLPEGLGFAEVGRHGPCSQSQLPLHVAYVGGTHASITTTGFERSCWRVVEAAEGAGWEVGAIVSSERPGARVSLSGFERPVVFEGRVLDADGTVLFAVPRVEVALDPEQVVVADAGSPIDVAYQEAWAEADVLHVAGAPSPEGELLAVTVDAPEGSAYVTWVHRIDGGFRVVTQRPSFGGAPRTTEATFASAAARALLARGGPSLALDDQLVLLGYGDDALTERGRVTLPAPPLALVDGYAGVIAHVPGALRRFRGVGEDDVIEVGDGVLLHPTRGGGNGWWLEGTELSQITGGATGFALAAAGTADDDVLDAVGRPLAFHDGVLVAERGWVIFDPFDGGPTHATTDDVFGGGRITHVGDDGATYVVEQDGVSRIVLAPRGLDFCE